MRTSYLLSVVAFPIIFFLSQCASSKKIGALKPEPDTDQPLVYESATSFVALPITLKIKDLENQANKALVGVIYDDKIIDGDNLIVKVTKQGPFQIANQNAKLRTILPLKIEGKIRYGTNALGLNLYDTHDFNLDVVITLLSDVAVSNWRLNTSTSLAKVDWKQSPTISLAGRNVPITYLLDPAVKLFKSKIEKAIDDAILQAADFKPQVLSALEKISVPLALNSEFQTWLKITPTELYSTESQLSQESILLNMGLKCTMETFIGQKPTQQFDKNSVQLKAVKSIPDKISIAVAAISSYEEVAALIAKNIVGQEFTSGKRKVSITKIQLWQKAGKLVVALDLIGSINGTIYLTGVPKYDKEKQEVYVDELSYVLDTKSKLLKSANWLVQGLVVKTMQEKCRYSIKNNLDDAKKETQKYLKNYSPMQGVFVNGHLDELDFDKIQLSNKAIVAFIKATGTMDVKVDGL